MKILLTGATGYIAQRLLPVLSGNGHEVVCCVRDKARFNSAKYRSVSISVVEVDFLKPETLQNIPADIDAAYYLIHSMSTSTGDFEKMEEVICKDNNLKELFGISPVCYEDAIREAFEKIELNQVPSSWKDALTSSTLNEGIARYAEVPIHGCFYDYRKLHISDSDRALQKIWSIGGKNGWYYGDWLWVIRGFIDKLFGGVGLRRGRKNQTEISPGDALDFWRVLIADKREKRLLLFAEMKLPGEAWLEFRIDDQNILHQTATFRPLGLWGRLYWYSVLPFHGFIFRGMIRNISS